MHPDWLRPDWSAHGVGGLMSTRAGGQSTAPFDRLNLGTGVGDDPAVVARNRAIFRAATDGAAPVFLKQVHGTRVVRLAHSHAASNATVEEADASVTSEPGLACTVLVADCLPVLFAAPEGRAVGAAHAGWRGLRAGVLEATLREVCAAGVCAPEEVSAWLGASIGPRRFEVGPDVLEAFGAADDTTVAACFAPLRPGKWLADLPRLARGRLAAAGLTRVTGGAWCTVEAPSRFFSFRRDGVTGRMAAAVWITRPGS